MIAVLLAAALMLAQSPAERKMALDAMLLEGPATRTIEKGDQSNIDDARQVLVRTESEWAALAAARRTGRARRSISARNGRRPVHGSRPNAGFSTAVISATAETTLIVRCSEHSRSGSVGAGPDVSYHLVAIPKASGDGSSRRFEKAAASYFFFLAAAVCGSVLVAGGTGFGPGCA
jgi:hypothetical protein